MNIMWIINCCIFILLSAGSLLCNGEIEPHSADQNQRAFNHIPGSSKGSGFNIYNLPDFVGFSYSRASLGGPKNRFISFEKKVEKS